MKKDRTTVRGVITQAPSPANYGIIRTKNGVNVDFTLRTKSVVRRHADRYLFMGDDSLDSTARIGARVVVEFDADIRFPLASRWGYVPASPKDAVIRSATLLRNQNRAPLTMSATVGVARHW